MMGLKNKILRNIEMNETTNIQTKESVFVFLLDPPLYILFLCCQSSCRATTVSLSQTQHHLRCAVTLVQ